MKNLIKVLLFSLSLTAISAQAEHSDLDVTLYLDSWSSHFNNDRDYNEHHHTKGIDINGYTYHRFTNSFYKESELMGFTYRRRINSYLNGGVVAGHVTGYEDEDLTFLEVGNLNLLGLPFVGAKVGPVVADLLVAPNLEEGSSSVVILLLGLKL